MAKFEKPTKYVVENHSRKQREETQNDKKNTMLNEHFFTICAKMYIQIFCNSRTIAKF